MSKHRAKKIKIEEWEREDAIKEGNWEQPYFGG